MSHFLQVGYNFSWRLDWIVFWHTNSSYRFSFEFKQYFCSYVSNFELRNGIPRIFLIFGFLRQFSMRLWHLKKITPTFFSSENYQCNYSVVILTDRNKIICQNHIFNSYYFVFAFFDRHFSKRGPFDEFNQYQFIYDWIRNNFMN